MARVPHAASEVFQTTHPYTAVELMRLVLSPVTRNRGPDSGFLMSGKEATTEWLNQDIGPRTAGYTEASIYKKIFPKVITFINGSIFFT